jgi:exopolysaccharide biosynthesis polyprenyl glycosylphosphotransferase
MASVFVITSASGMFGLKQVLAFWLTATLALLTLRAARRAMTQWPSDCRRVLILGNGPRGRALYEELGRCVEPRFDVLGFVDPAGDDGSPWGLGAPVLGTTRDLERILMEHGIDEVFVTLPVASAYEDICTSLQLCQRVGVRANYRADLLDSLQWTYGEDVDAPCVTVHVAPHDSRLLLKRALDLVVGAVGLAVFAPVMLGIALGIKMTSRGPVLFSQERYGLNRRVFRMHKFRTMVADAERLQESLETRNEMDGPVFKIREDPRITPLGRFLRRTSLDELPQLFNVLAGTMSLVGPRPLPHRDVRRFTEAALMRRFSVRPGLTCLWQISGRSNVSFERWIALDLQYIDRWSLTLDLAILARTIPVVFRGDGAV